MHVDYTFCTFHKHYYKSNFYEKILFALAATTMMAGNVFAEEATFTCKTDLGTATVAVTTWSQATISSLNSFANKGTAPAYNKAGDVRLYAKEYRNSHGKQRYHRDQGGIQHLHSRQETPW